MADIFISYAREDDERARQIADALGAYGWTVWWDRSLIAGQTFDEVIERELRAARCVIVLWSRSSVASQWVRSEASLAADAGTLIPVLIEPGIELPLRYRQFHCADLSSWNGNSTAEALQSLATAVRGKLSSDGTSDSHVPVRDALEPRRLPKSAKLAGVALAALLLVMIWAPWSARAPGVAAPPAATTAVAPTDAAIIGSATAGNATYAILGVTSERGPTQRETVLDFDVRVSVTAEPGINFWQDLFRLEVGGTRYAPHEEGSNKYVPAHSEWRERVRFMVPSGVTDATLHVGKGGTGSTAAIPVPRTLLRADADAFKRAWSVQTSEASQYEVRPPLVDNADSRRIVRLDSVVWGSIGTSEVARVFVRFTNATRAAMSVPYTAAVYDLSNESGPAAVASMCCDSGSAVLAPGEERAVSLSFALQTQHRTGMRFSYRGSSVTASWNLAYPSTPTIGQKTAVDSGMVRLLVAPRSAEIRHDGRVLGVGRIDVRLPAGPQTLRISAPDCMPEDLRIVVVTNETVASRVGLRCQ